MLTTQGIANSATRYNAFKLVMHQKYLLAYLLLILFSTLSFFSVVITGLYIWRHHAIKPAVYIMPVISVIFTILAYRLLKFWVGQSFKFAIREKG
jgi:hypothetical protein